ncbi:MAG: BatA domain-containing protein [Planctomycetota bacterium]
MSVLAPLYFLGAMAVALPIIFHLIRRQPKGQVEFSSLMFLRPTPPRLTRRSRLDNWPLLLIRALALTLLALAFCRPFLRSVALSDAELPGRRLMLVMDTSASMQRDGLWQQALDHADEVIDDLQPADQIAVVQFDAQPKSLLTFDRSSELTIEQRKSTARSLIRDLSPSWNATETGRALSFAGDLAVRYEVNDPVEVELGDEDDSRIATTSQATGPAQLILISDMQAGSALESLQVYTWPKELRLDVRKVVSSKRTNASATILQTAADDPVTEDRVRVRVTNSSDAASSRFSVRWVGDGKVTSSNTNELPVQVPPGQSRVVRMPLPEPGVTELVLNGDDQSFDNRHYLVSPEAEELSLWLVGDDPRDTRDSLLYYLQRVPLNNPYRNVAVSRIPSDAWSEELDPKKVPLIVLNQAVEADQAKQLKGYVSQGGRLLAVLTGDQTQVQSIAQAVNQIAGSSVQVSEADVNEYVMFSRIDFRHPVFAPMADPKFNDFTKIRFWNHRTIDGFDADWDVIVRFDDGDPALAEYPIGDGRLMVMATGWQPTSSQLAMSTKFIPLVFSLFESGGGATVSDRYVMGQSLDFEPSPTATITTPASTDFEYRVSADAKSIDQPGIYRFNDEQRSRRFAVNLPDSESVTTPISEDELERFGVVLGKNVTAEQARENQRQLRDRELESEQKLWQWLLVGALGLLGLETLLGMLWSRTRVGPGNPTAAAEAGGIGQSGIGQGAV